MFCGACGHHMEDSLPAAPAPAAAMSPRESARRRAATPTPGGGRTTMFFGAMQAARAKLVLIKGDGMDGVSFTLAGDDHLAGRVDAPLLFEEDPFLSPIHANFFYRTGQLIVSDEGSVNGVYLRTRGARTILFGDRFLVGEQLMEVQQLPSAETGNTPIDDGTYFFASPRRPSQVRLLQLLRGGDSGVAYHGDGDAITLGREGNDINFPDDPFISGHHAEIRFADGKLMLTDLDSKNGTFLRINKEQPLDHGDYVFMGQQLLRVEIV